MIKVLLLSDLSRDPDRQLVKGISKYAKNHTGWIFYQVSGFLRESPQHQDEILAKAEDLKVDAIFGTWPGLDPEKLPEMDIPIILRAGGLDTYGISSAHCDHPAVGRMAAEFLTGLNRKIIAFSGFDGVEWSKERYSGFISALGKSGIPMVTIRNSQSDWDKIVSWLSGLPKPASVFACNDNNARILIEICQSTGIRIPEDVAILGVDDDEFVCNLTTPALSTIKMDYESFGYRIGHLICNAVTSKSHKPFSIIHEPLGIIERSTTPASKAHDPYVKSVMSYMREHFMEGCSISDAVSGIPLSRRSIEMRFKREFGNLTMFRYLTELRLKKMSEMLISTELTFQEIAQSSGFLDNESAYRLFRKHFGCTPLEFRLVHRKG